MTAEVRSAGLAAAARVCRSVLFDLAESIAQNNRVEIVAAPAPASVLLEIDSAAGAFALSEVIVTTAEVRCEGVPGWGCVLGLDQEAALAAALLDAAPQPAVDDLAATALDVEARRRTESSRRIAATKV